MNYPIWRSKARCLGSGCPSASLGVRPRSFRLSPRRCLAGMSSSCTLHSSRALSLFCTTCQELICSECTMLSHSQHEFETVRPKTEHALQHIILHTQSRTQVAAVAMRQREAMRTRCSNVERAHMALDTSIDEADATIAALAPEAEAMRAEINDWCSARVHSHMPCTCVHERALSVHACMHGCMYYSCAHAPAGSRCCAHSSARPRHVYCAM